MRKIKKQQFTDMNGMQQKEYISNLLGIEDDTIYGILSLNNKENNRWFVRPYNKRGVPVQSILSDAVWGIRVHRDSNFKDGTYVAGRLECDEKNAYIESVHIMDSEDEFNEKLLERLNKEWKKEDFQFHGDEITHFGGDVTAFDKWVAEKVVGSIKKEMDRYISGKRQELENEKNEQQAILTAITGRIKIKQKEQAEKEATLATVTDQLAQKTQMIQDLETKSKELEKERIDLEEQVKKICDEYERYGLPIHKKEINDTKTEYKYAYNKKAFSKLIDEVWEYLWLKEDLYYERDTIQYFMDALKTKQLILLWGNPGTGKTSLPDAVANAIQGKCVRIQVQSNWTDNQDLLGFYNIIDKQYVATRFIDALVEAKEHPETMYFILLDEMNLSKIEYYFSEMLNFFTSKTPYNLYLYSERIWKEAKHDLKRMEAKIKQSNSEFQEYEMAEVMSRKKMLGDYPAAFEIPNNVRFIGTLNTDATTQSISPKVVDRSCCIELQTLSKEIKEREKAKLSGKPILDGAAVRVSAQVFNHELNDVKPLEFRENIEFIREALRLAGISISNRLDFYIEQWERTGTDVTLDEVVLTKILPCIELDAKNKQQLQVFKNLLEQEGEYHCAKSIQKLKMMEEKAGTYSRIKYWEM